MLKQNYCKTGYNIQPRMCLEFHSMGIPSVKFLKENRCSKISQSYM